jgi:hypothetical protein
MKIDQVRMESNQQIKRYWRVYVTLVSNGSFPSFWPGSIQKLERDLNTPAGGFSLWTPS